MLLAASTKKKWRSSSEWIAPFKNLKAKTSVPYLANHATGI